MTSLTAWLKLVPFEESQYPKTSEWMKKMEKLPYYTKASVPGLKVFEKIVDEKLLKSN